MFKITRSLVGVATSRITSNLPLTNQTFIASRSFHCSRPTFGIEEFFDNTNTKEEGFVTGRAWTAADLRRKVDFGDVILFDSKYTHLYCHIVITEL
jgi:hypothetical protein